MRLSFMQVDYLTACFLSRETMAVTTYVSICVMAEKK